MKDVPVSAVTDQTDLLIDKMARMHSGAKGKSGSKRPSQPTKVSWDTIDKAELEKLIVKFAKEGKTSSEIGLTLRDSYGIPDASIILGKNIYAIIKENKLQGKVPEDLQALMKRAFALRKHVETNGQDKDAKRGIILTDSKINRLVKYYKESGVLEATFKYRPVELNIYIEN